MESRAALLQDPQHLLVDRPLPNVCRITLNRPHEQNMLTQRTRAQLFNQLQINDQDPDVRVTIIRGAGADFCSGNDFDTFRDEPLPFFEPEGDGQTQRNVLNGWFMINDLAKPVIAQVHGEALGGGMELAAACDVCIVAEDASIGYPAVRGQGLPDYQIYPWLCGMRNAMEIMLMNRPMTGVEAGQRGFATEVVPTAELEARTLDFAARVAKIPADLLAFNKRSVHRAFETMGLRTNLRNAVDLESLMFKAPGAKILTARRVQARRAPGEAPPKPSLPPPAARQGGATVAAQAVSSTEAPGDKPPRPAVPKPAAAAAPAKAVGPARPAPPKPAATAAPKPAATAAPKPAATAAPKPAATAAPKPAATAAPKPAVAAKPTPGPVAKPAAAAAKTPAATPIKAPAAKPAAAPAAQDGEDAGEVHIHLHQPVTINIVGSAQKKTPSKL